MNVRLVGLGVLACGSLMMATGVSAAERGFYVGAAYGKVKNDATQAPYDLQASRIYTDFGFQQTQSATSFDTEDSGFSFLGGYRLFDHFAIEGGYVDLGEVSFRDDSSGMDVSVTPAVPANWNQSARSQITGLTLSALAILPLSYRSEIYARGGIVFSTRELGVRVSDGQNSASDSISESDTDWVVGVGGGFTFAEIYTLRLEYQRYLDAGDGGIGYYDVQMGEADVDMLSLGFTVAF
ncbi:opacity protein-like surface antigen [Povalibacter uvarum]|uniref:Opacity protein-like surface antigen n=1 Tax=Povalibacter uvarum TaxID=732238 RepID=A0A841HS77_9GAMM|nr:outer membrane beta-barrel protein [Povalibacter uvarum]MBB6095746.1 opacity protein-like surface antigen [Povalibacter uvarum]